MSVLAPGIRLIDLNFQGMAGVIATAVLDTPDGVLLIDPGPSTSVPRLTEELSRAGIGWPDVCGLLLTHIHLDHAGSCGLLMRDHLRLRLYVHERGAPHMVDPARLLESATRLYGDAMDTLWGPFLPAPADRVTALKGEERLDFKSRTLEVAYTPGHASHHVAYFDTDARIAFCGDVGGTRIAGLSSVLPPTPPPDINLELWETSIARILRWSPASLFLTHFGAVDDSPAVHLATLQDRLVRYANRVKALMDAPMNDAERVEAFVAEVTADLRRENAEGDVARYRKAAPIDQCYQGLVRYWTKKAAAPRPA
jgi:glyoxylase-like metal-dependent hydrolase (beta-lactamase superfamily II)